MKPSKPAMLSAAAIILLILTGACSSKPFLIVYYQLPQPTDTLAGKEVSLVIADIRETQTFLSESAKKSFREFNETYSLVVLKEDGSGNLLGVYAVDALIAEIFKQRLNNLGLQVQVSPSANKSEYELEIKLKEFKLDLAGSKWIINMSYQANLLKNSRLLAMESVNGSAERLKVMGKSDAEKVLGELMTDMVNKLDLVKLFQQAQR
ncbi:hypothetical protein D1BOALGB6SA_7300 [Olavius sp. associated proteobacterium Delta 1]|nr:hypothetical protein D1BOALGB6SA_7300 [Olavius sp. associated proteobacterium Delta 1]